MPFPAVLAMGDLLTNSKALRDYLILETYEAGIALRGTEVKSLRGGKGQLADSFARVEDHQVWLYNFHIDEYAHGNLHNHNPKAKRRLLLHASEIRKLFGLTSVKGNTLVPLSCYWKGNRLKIRLGVGKGKVEYDKRQDLRQREADRDIQRATAKQLRGR